MATPGKRQRQGDLPEGSPRRCAQVSRGFKQALVELFQRHINRRHHQRQETINRPNQNGGRRIQQPHIGDANPAQPRRNAFRPQDHDPRIIAHQLAGPERRHHQHKHHHAPFRRYFHGQKIGHRKGNDCRQQSAKRCERQGIEKRLAARRKVQIIVESEGRHIAARCCPLPEGKHEHHHAAARSAERKRISPPGPATGRSPAGNDCLNSRMPQADLKRAMISARSGLVSVAAAPNSSGDKASAAG